jgi:hypothetical protein
MSTNALAILASLLLGVLSGCAMQKYWVQPGKNLQQTSVDLYECRKTGLQAGVAYTGFELEAPCMTAKGYRLSDSPPPDH